MKKTKTIYVRVSPKAFKNFQERVKNSKKSAAKYMDELFLK